MDICVPFKSILTYSIERKWENGNHCVCSKTKEDQKTAQGKLNEWCRIPRIEIAMHDSLIDVNLSATHRVFLRHKPTFLYDDDCNHNREHASHSIHHLCMTFDRFDFCSVLLGTLFHAFVLVRLLV